MYSMMIESNIRKLSRMELIYTCISKLAVSVNKANDSALPEDLRHYTDPNDFKGCTFDAVLLIISSHGKLTSNMINQKEINFRRN